MRKIASVKIFDKKTESRVALNRQICSDRVMNSLVYYSVLLQAVTSQPTDIYKHNYLK